MRSRAATDVVITWTAWASTLLVLSDLSALSSAAIAATVALTVSIIVAALRGYSPCMGFGRVLEHRQLLRASMLAGGLALLANHLWIGHLDIQPILVATMVAGLATQVGRAVVDRREDALRRDGVLVERVLVAADGATLHRLLDLIDEQSDMGWRVMACVGGCAPEAAARGLAHVGIATDLADHIERWNTSLLVVSADSLEDEAFFGEVIAAHRRGTDVHVHAGLRGLDARLVRAAPIGHDTVLHLEQARLLGCQQFAKRALDILIASATIIIVSPLLIATAVAIKLGDGGPVLFRQRRVGRNGTVFDMPKFRSMRVDAEQQLQALRALNERDGVLFKMRSDPRVTGVGRIIRALSIDEFPQLVSVLRGHMSLIGPRPALPEEVAMFDHRLTQRHDVRPGITGLWQVEARESESFAAYRRLDIFYVENWSLLLDFSILLHTAPAVLERGMRSLRRNTTAAPIPSTDAAYPAPLAGHADEIMAELRIS